MGTSMTCALAHAADRGASCQTVILVRATASASNPPAGPAACQDPPASAKMPVVPARAQVAASIGIPAAVNVAAVRFCSPQLRPAGVAARDRCVARVVQLV